MEKDWGTVLIQNWGPMLILVVVWVYFMRRYGRGGAGAGRETVTGSPGHLK